MICCKPGHHAFNCWYVQLPVTTSQCSSLCQENRHQDHALLPKGKVWFVFTSLVKLRNEILNLHKVQHKIFIACCSSFSFSTLYVFWDCICQLKATVVYCAVIFIHLLPKGWPQYSPKCFISGSELVLDSRFEIKVYIYLIIYILQDNSTENSRQKSVVRKKPHLLSHLICWPLGAMSISLFLIDAGGFQQILAGLNPGPPTSSNHDHSRRDPHLLFQVWKT